MAIERRPAKPRHDRSDLVGELVSELAKPDEQTRNPLIIEEEQAYGDALHVTVIWDKWSGVPVEQRGAIISDAYRDAGRTEELRRATLVIGLTREETLRLGIDES